MYATAKLINNIIKQLLRKEIENCNNIREIKHINIGRAIDTARKQKIYRFYFPCCFVRTFLVCCVTISYTHPPPLGKQNKKYMKGEYIRKRARLYNTSDKKQTNNTGFHIRIDVVSLKRCLSFIYVCV
jgi:hypothetical protein